MSTYLRFTEDFAADMEAGSSYLNIPSVKNKKLNGLCAFTFDLDDMTQEEIISRIKMYAKNYPYLNTSTAVIFEGEYAGNNPNGEGVLASPIVKINTYYL